MFQDEFLDLLVRDLRRRTMDRQFGVTYRQDRIRLCGCVCFYTYAIGIRVAQVEKVFRIGRVGFGFEDTLDTVRAANTHGESHAAYEDVHIVL